MVDEINDLNAVNVNIKKPCGGQWPLGTLGHYNSLTCETQAPPELMFAMCKFLNDWTWLDAINASAGRTYSEGEQ